MWIPYDKFKNIKYLDKGGFGTIYEAIWSDKNMKVVLKCLNNLNDSENFNEFLDEWKNHYKCIGSKIIVHLYGFTKNPKTSNYTVVMDYADKDLMKKCWDGDLLKRPSTSEVLNVIKRWIYLPSEMEIKNISEELKSNIMEFINAPIGYIKPTMTESHPQAYHTSRLFNFTSKKLNEILESECSDFTNEKSNKILKSESLDDCIV
ncbi:uncharacterized protein OCT59_024200 [Rhizophagus irregularis]|uniref:uncharacterized protein n=1 Tax=Rhizophagus irregularis TaxID=588596 RepID=UPI001C162234|nr:hypothetical protein OCT59_024200 [Rhizophagus irregularis]CAB5364633.1 unnamed protein product [Rhizophagus irregularis]